MTLKEFVKLHDKWINIADRVNKLYKIIIFYEYLVLSLLLCVCELKFIIGHIFEQKIEAILHIFAALIDLTIYSYGGQKVLDTSSDVCKDCYNMNKDYQIIMSRVKHELKIKAPMYVACLPALSLVIGQTCSLVTLFQKFV